MREKKEEGITVTNEDGKDEFSVSFACIFIICITHLCHMFL